MYRSLPEHVAEQLALGRIGDRRGRRVLPARHRRARLPGAAQEDDDRRRGDRRRRRAAGLLPQRRLLRARAARTSRRLPARARVLGGRAAAVHRVRALRPPAPRLPATSCAARRRELLDAHLARAPAENPFARFGSGSATTCRALLDGRAGATTPYAFATLRQSARPSSVAALVPRLARAATTGRRPQRPHAFADRRRRAKTLLFKLARAARPAAARPRARDRGRWRRPGTARWSCSAAGTARCDEPERVRVERRSGPAHGGLGGRRRARRARPTIGSRVSTAELAAGARARARRPRPCARRALAARRRTATSTPRTGGSAAASRRAARARRARSCCGSTASRRSPTSGSTASTSSRATNMFARARRRRRPPACAGRQRARHPLPRAWSRCLRERRAATALADAARRDADLRWFRTTLLGRTARRSRPAPAPVGPWRPVALERRRLVAVDDLRACAPRSTATTGLVNVARDAAPADGSRRSRSTLRLAARRAATTSALELAATPAA